MRGQTTESRCFDALSNRRLEMLKNKGWGEVIFGTEAERLKRRWKSEGESPYLEMSRFIGRFGHFEGTRGHTRHARHARHPWLRQKEERAPRKSPKLGAAIISEEFGGADQEEWKSGEWKSGECISCKPQNVGDSMWICRRAAADVDGWAALSPNRCCLPRIKI